MIILWKYLVLCAASFDRELYQTYYVIYMQTTYLLEVRMKKTMLTLILLLMLSACGAPATEAVVLPEIVDSGMPVPESTATEAVVEPDLKIPGSSFESQLYFNETVGFALDYPVGWTAQETLAGERGTQVTFASSSDLVGAAEVPVGASRVNLTIYDWDPKNDLTAYVDKTKTAWQASGFEIMEEQPLTLDLGLPAVQFTVRTPDLPTPFLIAAVGDKYLVLSGEGDLALVYEIMIRLRPITQ